MGAWVNSLGTLQIMTKVDIWKVQYFRQPGKLERLNEHIKIHGSFQMHQIATATGCTLQDAFMVLHYASIAGVLQETTIFYEKSDSIALYIGELVELKVYDEDRDLYVEEPDLTWEPFFYLDKGTKTGDWEFIRSL